MQAPITIQTFYHFMPLPDPEQWRIPLLTRMQTLGIRGTITLSTEGINATISGNAEAIETLMSYLHSSMELTLPTFRESHFAAQPFQRTKVKVKKELISLGVASHPAQCVGRYVRAKEWNRLITQPGILLIDTRNHYEFEMGHFRGAVNPQTHNFKQMVAWTKQNLSPTTHPRIAMYCTGGIRCDKYSSYLMTQGFDEIYHLHGGILAYLEAIPEQESLWQGECFVFDERVCVGHGLTTGNPAQPQYSLA